ncbi:hypothetical protein RDWZM_009015 [Blomia tropicalis]|uniref:Protein kinase domain-containing protein n=1 Tax=Blomia tropicalis TaxID=40697 RepID=A0A9Q0M362_BLOTA|nr:hypothetical protein RDWZM_009015 [Blomia tropicalis]
MSESEISVVHQKINEKENVTNNNANKLETNSLVSIPSKVDDFWHSVLSLCFQNNPNHFGLEFPSSMYDQFEYLDSGTYSHVIKAFDKSLGNVPIVFKIIKVIQRELCYRMTKISLNGFELYSETFQEIVIVKMLSKLHQTICDEAGYEYCTHAYPRLYRTRVVHGDIPNYFLIGKYDETYSKVKPIEHFKETIGVPREHLVLVMKYGGQSLWDLLQATDSNRLMADQLISICYQITMALWVAEAVLQFEHRDLHMCNVLVKRTKKASIEYKYRSNKYRVKSYGIKICLIDNTFSRIAMAGVPYYTNLSARLRDMVHKTEPEEHEVAYAEMYRLIGDCWRDWFPITNLIWMRQMFTTLAHTETFRTEADHHHKMIIERLIQLTSKCSNVAEYVTQLYKQKKSTINASRTSIANNSILSLINL